MLITNPTNNNMVNKNKRINELESLHGILALWVVISHILPSAGIREEMLGSFKFLAKGDDAVDLFIIMSGFFIFFYWMSLKKNMDTLFYGVF